MGAHLLAWKKYRPVSDPWQGPDREFAGAGPGPPGRGPWGMARV